METDWLIDNAIESRGFVAMRVQIYTYKAITMIYGIAYALNHKKSSLGWRDIGQILSPADLYTQK